MFTTRSIFESIQLVISFIYYCFEAFILCFFCVRKNVAGKIVLVTGSAHGIGREIALNFACLGSVLVLWDINEEDNNATAKLVKANGAQAVYTYKCDLHKREEIYAVADKVKREVGNVEILINNAGILKRKTFFNLSDSDMEQTLEVNTNAHFWIIMMFNAHLSLKNELQTCKAFLPAMIASNQGHLVTTASIAALVGSNQLTDYCASKAAAFEFLESLAFEMRAAGKKGIKTTIACPYYVNTELVSGVKTKRPFLLPILDAEYVAKEIVDGILKEKLYVVLPPYARLIVLKIFLPRKAVFLLAEYLGLFNNLDEKSDYKGTGSED